MTVIHDLPGPDLDLILHSPGGSPHTAESIVRYLRSKFSSIRVIVPSLAMSAATMIACAADSIVLGKHSFLGPIDPQIVVTMRHTGPVFYPAHAILDQFELAKRECGDPRKMGAWVPMLPQYGPALLVQCKHALKLAKDLVTGWLGAYMFRGKRGAARKGSTIARQLSSHSRWKSHGRQIGRDDLEKMGLRIDKLEDDPVSQDLFLSVFHATTHTFSMTPAVKIIENSIGKAFVQQVQVSPVPVKTEGPQDPLQGKGLDGKTESRPS
ncbi:MAG TPA: serine protease [Phycisphaerae bacterium]|nr:serine protease [Phycisphaerae bacterium]